MMNAIIRKPRTAPGPRGYRTSINNLFQLKYSPIAFNLRLYREYGDLVSYYVGPYIVHQIAHPDYARYVLQENYRNYTRGVFYGGFKPIMGKGLLTTDGDDWFYHRRIAQPSFHRPVIQSYLPRMTAAVTARLDKWESLARTGEPVDVLPEMMRISLSMLGSTLFDTDLGDVEPKIRWAILTWLEAMIKYHGSLNEMLPDWAPLPQRFKLRKARAILDELIGDIIKEHYLGLRGNSDFISKLMDTPDERTGRKLTATELRDEVMTSFMAGHETVGTSLGWAMYAIAKYPEVRRQLEAELAQVLNGRTPTLADLPNLPYSLMVAQETLRVYPPIFMFPRDVIEPDEIGGFHIPAKSSVFLASYTIHRHPEFWDNPEAFDPENFTPAKITARPRFTYLPFGAGPRQCIGNNFAMQELQLAIAMVVQRFRLELLAGHPVEPTPGLLSLRPRYGIMAYLRSRQAGTGKVRLPLGEAITKESLKAALAGAGAADSGFAADSGAADSGSLTAKESQAGSPPPVGCPFHQPAAATSAEKGEAKV
jgi:cytochrome P450